LISISLKGTNNPFYGKKHSFLSKKLISLGRSKKIIYVHDNLLYLKIVFSSMTELAKSIDANNKTLKNYINNNRLFRGK
jgi:hypothetical protein